MVFRKIFFLKMIVGTFQTTSKQLFSYIFHILKLVFFWEFTLNILYWAQQKILKTFEVVLWIRTDIIWTN